MIYILYEHDDQLDSILVAKHPPPPYRGNPEFRKFAKAEIAKLYPEHKNIKLKGVRNLPAKK